VVQTTTVKTEPSTTSQACDGLDAYATKDGSDCLLTHSLDCSASRRQCTAKLLVHWSSLTAASSLGDCLFCLHCHYMPGLATTTRSQHSMHSTIVAATWICAQEVCCATWSAERALLCVSLLAHTTCKHAIEVHWNRSHDDVTWVLCSLACQHGVNSYT